MKYNVGDKVKIKEDLSVGKDYNNFYFTKDMREFLGKEVTIACVSYSDYYIKEDSGEFCWTDEMIEGLVDELDNEENKINEEQLTVYDIDFTKLKHGDAIYISNKEEYDYCINELNNLGYVWQSFINLNNAIVYTNNNPILLIIKTNKIVSYMDVLEDKYNDCGELNILNKIINESNKNILDDIDFSKLKENDVIICGNKENYDYVVDELYSIGYKFYNNKSDGYKWFGDDVIIYISCENILKFSDIDYLYNDYEEEYGLKLSDITIIDLREKNIKNIEDNSIKCSRIITNTQNSKLKNPNKNDILFSINNQINNIINMWNIKNGNYDIESYNKQLDIVERLLKIKERL